MIEIKNLTKSFGANIVLDHLNLLIPSGKITFIVGKSGDGKTVLLKHIIGLLKPDSGRIIVDGDDITDYTTEQLFTYRRKLGILFQGAALFDGMTVGENVIFPLQEHTTMLLPAMLARAEEVLIKVGLPNFQQKYSADLTTEERKRVGLARALVNWPKIVLYDEPTTGMDPFICEIIDALIVRISKEEKGLTSLVVSHDIEAALTTADNIIFLYKGKVELEGKAHDFRASKNPIVRQFFAGSVKGPMEFN